MEHYICKGGCKGVSEKSGVCQVSHCPRRDKPLENCECHDMKHHGVFDRLPDDNDGPVEE